MKKIVVLIVCLFLVSGCTNVKETSYEDLITGIVTSKYDIVNEFRTGYKYYIPSGMASTLSKDYNEVISNANDNYYLYVDVVSYYNRVISEYNVDNKAFFSMPINFEDKYGYIEINKQTNGKYLVEIMYNYAKIEVMVEESNLKSAVANSMIILSSINYNSNILESIVGDNVLDFNDETFNIFKTKKKERNYLDVEASDIYEDEAEEIKDPDLID